MTHQFRTGGHLRSLIVMAAIVILLSPAAADRLLDFTVTAEQVAGMATAAINADGMVVMRLRAKTARGLEAKAGVVASRLTDLALRGLRPAQVQVERVDGEWAVTGAGSLIITADADTSAAAGVDAKSLCESWQVRVKEVLAEPYLTVKPRELLVVPFNESRGIEFGGTTVVKPVIQSMSPGIASVESKAGGAVVRGTGTGTTVVMIEAGDLCKTVTIHVKKWAARITGSAVLTKLPGGLPDVMRDTALMNAALSAVDAEPRATVRMTNLTSSGAGYSVCLSADGDEYLPVSRDVAIAVRQDGAGIPGAHSLLLSNYPEKVVGTGALMRQRLTTGVSSRLMWHHKNYAGRPIVAAVRLVNAGTEKARFRLGWAEAGPNPDEIYVGFNAMLRYWETVRRAAGFIATVPPGRAYETSAMLMGHHDVVSGLMDVVAEAGSNLYVEMLARDPRDAPHGFSVISSNASELAVTPYQFPATLQSEMDYEVGGRFEHLSIGRENVENEDGFVLAGAYGINHLVAVNASNPTGAAATLEVALRAGGGVARSVVAVDGTLISSGVLSAGHEQILERRLLPPGATTKIRLEIIPTAGSNLPFTLVVRSQLR